MGHMLVFTNAVEGRDDEFDAWYRDVHVPEVVAVPPFTGARRFRLTDAQRDPDQPYRFVAIYEFDGPPEGAIEALRVATPTFRMTEALALDPPPRVILMEEV